ncbi:MAG: hypothetical protein JXA99_01765 [Candidatus Lokiarchaeota archaeon]|nr:hypothetical protein [Candidatus Lokiarchaeota archaeon]
MNIFKNRKNKIEPVNLLLLGVSLLIFGGLGIIFMTQMEVQTGWVWQDMENEYPIKVTNLQTDDIDNDGINDIIAYINIKQFDKDHENEILYDTPKFGGVIAFNAKNGEKLWQQTFDNPVEKVFPIMDINSDNIIDYFVSVSPVDENWDESNPNFKRPIIYFDQFINFIILGNDGSNATGYNNFTTNPIADLVSLDDPYDAIDDLFCLELWNTTSIYDQFKVNLTSYTIDGNKNYNEYTGSTMSFDDIYKEEGVFPDIFLYNHQGEEQLFFIDRSNFKLLDVENLNISNPIYSNSLEDNILSIDIIKDLNFDGNSEIAIITKNDTSLATLHIFNGSNGGLLNYYSIITTNQFETIKIKELGNEISNDETFLAVINEDHLEMEDSDIEEIALYRINISTCNLVWGTEKSERSSIFLLNEDLDGDLLDEIIIIDIIRPFGSIDNIRRIIIRSTTSNKNLAIINTNMDSEYFKTINDFNGDGKNDLLITGWQNFYIITSQDPIDLWLSPDILLSIPFFIILIACLIIGFIFLIPNIKKLHIRREEIKQNIRRRRLAIIVNIISIALMTITFLLFLMQLNVFNLTLIMGNNMTSITIVFILVSIIWYGMLPLTAAIFNQFSHRFAFFFIRVRNFFFKISKKYNNEIIILDMGNRKELGVILKIKRIILPLLLSIAVGFYSYNTLAPIMGYNTNFESFGGTQFLNFIVGYNVLCMLPMILSFVIFSFFIAGNYLLDDAGVVFFRQPKKHRAPGDVESISVWSQSMIKGIAGISALFTFITFLSHIDFSGFFQGDSVFFIIFGAFMVIVVFWGTPFFTSFSYILFAEEIMEFSRNDNIKKLYKKMEDHGYNTTPRKLTNLYPSGFLIKDKNK